LLSLHVVTPSSQRPLVQVPGSQTEQVTKPSFLPHVERAAQRTTLPLQLTSRRPLETASFSAGATQLTCWPWFAVQEQDARISSRTAGASGSVQAARAGEAKSARPPASTRPRANLCIWNPPRGMSSIGLAPRLRGGQYVHGKFRWRGASL